MTDVFNAVRVLCADEMEEALKGIRPLNERAPLPMFTDEETPRPAVLQLRPGCPQEEWAAPMMRNP